MNQAVNSTIILSEAFKSGDMIGTRKSFLGQAAAQQYKPKPDVLYFQASQSFGQASVQSISPFEIHGDLETPVIVVGTVRCKKDFACSSNMAAALMEEPDEAKIGTHRESKRSFIVPYNNAVAMDGVSANLFQLMQAKDGPYNGNMVLAVA